MNLRRWLLLAVVLASFWPRLIAVALFVLDDRATWDTANEFDALALVFTIFPLGLILYALSSFRRSPNSSGILLLLAGVAFIVSTLPAILSAYAGGLGASSKEDAERIEWATVAVLTIPLFGFLVLLLAIYYAARGFISLFRAQRRCA